MRERSAKVHKERKRAERLSKVRSEFREVIAAVGLQTVFAKLPIDVRDVVRQPYPKARISIEVDPSDKAGSNIRDAVESLITTTLVVCDGRNLSLERFFRFFVPLLHYFNAIKPWVETSPVAIATQISNLFFERHAKAFLAALLRRVDKVLIEHTKIDSGIWWSKIVMEPLPRGGNRPLISIYREPPNIMYIGLDGKSPQPAYRCGAPSGVEGLYWVNWPSSLVRREGLNREYPVYVQQHALDHLRERVRISGSLVDDFMWQSLRKPVILPGRRSDEFLVEYRFFQWLLGYLPVRRLDDKIVVKTFLFLTMDGTPQHLQLYDKLRLVRADKVAKELDTLNVFLSTDIQNDPVLRQVFHECDCGHLFDMIKPEAR